jgi:hypothetical protein
MPSKKISKVTEESPKVEEETIINKKPSKSSKSKKNDAVETTPVEEPIIQSEPTKSSKSRKKIIDEVVQPIIDEPITLTESKSSKSRKKIIDEVVQPIIDEPIILNESKPNKSNKKFIDEVVQSIIDDLPPKKAVKSKKKEVDAKTNTEPTKTSEPEIIADVKNTKQKKEIKPKISVEPEATVEETVSSEDQLEQKLVDTKTQWHAIVNKLHDNEIERVKLEAEKDKVVKVLKEMLDKLQAPNDTQLKGFLIDNKVQLNNTKNDIISIKNDSISESESCNESSDSDSEDRKPLLINKSSKTKTLIKTTKGNSKGPKLSINDSESDSD